MKKRTIVGQLQDRLAEEVSASDLRVVDAGKVTITQGSNGHVIAVGDTAC